MRHWNPQHIVLVANPWNKVFTLPMRHWNNSAKYMEMQNSGVFTLPMRHWNLLSLSNSFSFCSSFYPTYEALKQSDIIVRARYKLSFYPTYEALKLSSVMSEIRKRKGFYPTYEALKHSQKNGLFVEFFVFTLPMRHWNFSTLNNFLKFSIVFLPYLWGIETRVAPRLPSLLAWFLPYLWGIETFYSFKSFRGWKLGFYPTYEALKLLRSWKN